MQCVPENNLSDNQYRTCDTSAASFSQKSKSLKKNATFHGGERGIQSLNTIPKSSPALFVKVCG